MKTIKFLLVYFICCVASVSDAATFTNPIKSGAADPHVYYHDGYYYFLYTTGDGVWVRKHSSLHEVGNAPGKKVWGWNHEIKGHVWAPEIAYLNGRWYIYASGSLDPHQLHMRMFVLEATSQDAQGSYTYKGLLSPHPAIDQSVWQDPNNGQIWVTWSQWTPEQSILIAKMNSPTQLNNHQVQLSSPVNHWERHGWPVNEGSQFLQKGSKMHIVFSVNGCATAEYGLATLTADMNSNWLDPRAWKKSAGPVFAKKPSAGVYGPGHHSTVKTPNGEYWLVYHAVTNPSGACNGERTTRMQRFHFDGNDNPVFGEPVALGVPLAVPGSSNGNVSKPINNNFVFDPRVFNVNHYHNTYPDLQRAFNGNHNSLRNHWRESGIREGRHGHSDFSAKAYLERYGDLKRAFGNDYQAGIKHYLTFGINEGRNGRLGNSAGPSSGSVIQQGKAYRIISKHSGKVLDVAQARKDNSAPIHQWDYVGGNNQHWIAQGVSRNIYSLKSVNSQRCLDVPGYSGDDGAQLQQWTCHSDTNQQWKFSSKAGGYYEIKSQTNGKCLDVRGFSKRNGGAIHQWACHGGDNQLWRIEAIK